MSTRAVGRAFFQNTEAYWNVQQRFGVLAEFDLMSNNDIELRLQLKHLLVFMRLILSLTYAQNSVSLGVGISAWQRKSNREASTGISQLIFKLLHTAGVSTAFPNTQVFALKNAHFYNLLELRLWCNPQLFSSALVYRQFWALKETCYTKLTSFIDKLLSANHETLQLNNVYISICILYVYFLEINICKWIFFTLILILSLFQPIFENRQFTLRPQDAWSATEKYDFFSMQILKHDYI